MHRNVNLITSILQRKKQFWSWRWPFASYMLSWKKKNQNYFSFQTGSVVADYLTFYLWYTWLKKKISENITVAVRRIEWLIAPFKDSCSETG